MTPALPSPPAAEPMIPRRDRRSWLAAALGLVALLLLTFPDAVAGRAAIDGIPHLRWSDALYGPPPGKAGLWDDASSELAHQPWDRRLIAIGRRGELPLWLPEQGFGEPLLANGQAAPLSPYKWLLLPWSDGAWTPAFMLGRLAVAGLGTLALAAALGLSPLAGFLAGAGFMLHGFFCFHLLLPDVHVFMFLPWLVLAAEALRRRPTPRRIAVVGMVVGLAALLGHAESALYVALGAVVAYLVASRAARDPLGRRALAMAAALVLGAGVAAIAVLPFLEFVRLSETYLAGNRHLFPWMHLWHIALYSAVHLVTPVGTNPNYGEFIGVAPALLAPLGLAVARARPITLALVGTAAAIYALFPPVGLLVGVPYLPNSFYATPLLALGLALLAGAGCDRLLAGRGERLATGLALASLVAGLALAAYALAPVPQRLGDMRTAAAMLLLTAAILQLPRLTGAPRVLQAAALVLVTCVDLGLGARALVPGLAPLGYPETPIVRRIKEAGGLGRAAGFGEALLPDTNVAHAIPSIEQLEAFHLRRYSAFMAALNRTPRPAIFNFRLVQPGFDPLLADLAGLRWLVVGPGPRGTAVRAQLAAAPGRYVPAVSQREVTLFESRSAFSRARVLHAADFVPEGSPEAERRLVGAAPSWRERVLIETPDGRPPAGWRDVARQATPAEVVSYAPHHVEVRARLDHPGWLVLADAHYPGWVAEIDGRPAAIHPAYVAFRGVRLEAGEHRVVFRFAPRSVQVGLTVSLLALCLALLALAWPTRSRARSSEP